MRTLRQLAKVAVLVTAALALPLSVGSGSASAATAGAAAPATGVTGISMTPGVLELELPSAAVDFPFTVANNEPRPVHLDFSVRRLTQSEDGSMGYAEASPLQVTPTQVLLQPGEHADIRVTGALPAGAPALYAGLLAEPRGGAVSGNVEIRTRVAALLLLTRPGEHRRSLEVTDVTLTPTTQERTYRVGALLRNTGEVHVRPQGVVRIAEPGGPVLGTATLSGMVILPGATRRLDGGLWTAPPPPLEQVRMDVDVTEPAATGGKLVRLPEAPEAGEAAPPVVPGGNLGELGGDGPGGMPWIVWLAVALLLAVTALLIWHWQRRDGGLPGEAVSCQGVG